MYEKVINCADGEKSSQISTNRIVSCGNHSVVKVNQNNTCIRYIYTVHISLIHCSRIPTFSPIFKHIINLIHGSFRSCSDVIIYARD